MQNILQLKRNSGAATGKQQGFCILQHWVMPGLNGQTCDNWIDLTNLTWEPNFYKYMHDAFSPIGLMVDFWDDKIKKGAEIAIFR